MDNKEAIKIINQYDMNFHWNDGEPIPAEQLVEAFDLAIAALEQQEKAFDEWCTDCKEYDHNRNCCPRYNRVIRGAVDEVNGNLAKEKIEAEPAAEVAPVVHGKWIPQDHNKRIGCATTAVFYYPKCSACGHNGNYDMYYCPNCGAKMDGGDEHEQTR